MDFKRPPARVLANIVRSIGIEHLKPIAPPPQEALPRWRRIAEGLRHSKTRDAEAIHHHYDVSNTFYEWVLGPSMTYTCACYPAPRRLARGGAGEQVPAGVREAAAEAGRPAAGRRLRLGRHGPLRRRHGVKAIGVTLSKEQAAWAQKAIAEQGLTDLAEVRHGDYRDVRRDRVRRGVVDRADRAHRRAQLPVVLPLPAVEDAPRRAAAQPLHHPPRQPDGRACAAVSSTATCSPTGSSPGPAGSSPRRRTSAWRCVHEENLRHHYALTLRDWCRNLVEHWDEAVDEVGLPDRQGVGPLHGGLTAGLRDQCRSAAPGSRGQARRTTATTAVCRCGRGGRPRRQLLVPGGPRKSVVSCGNG